MPRVVIRPQLCSISPPRWCKFRLNRNCLLYTSSRDAVWFKPVSTLKGIMAVSYTHLDVYKRQVCILSCLKSVSFHSVTKVTFSELTDKEIDYYITKFKPWDKAGAYGIQAVSYTHLDVYKRQISSWFISSLPLLFKTNHSITLSWLFSTLILIIKG